MCGIAGVIGLAGSNLSLSDAQALRLRDALAHRGPDDAALWRGDSALLMHRRLAVRDLSPAGRQPLVSPRGLVLVYNGEIYNDAEVRRDLQREGAEFQSSCDAETVLLALEAWGPRALHRLRGMFALGLWDPCARTLLLARDALGIKPLVWAMPGGVRGEVAFASEPAALFQHPRLAPEPDAPGMLAYLATSRPVLGERTMFAGVHAVEPGGMIEFDLSDACRGIRARRERWASFAPVDPAWSAPSAAAAVRSAVEDAVTRHLVSDAPSCLLLSGGLDSTIIASCALRAGARLPTFASGTDDGGESGDLACAVRAAGELGLEVTPVPVTREAFADEWGALVDRLGAPLGTPNEVAIAALARRLRADGFVVCLSGEGADELFGGYAPALELAHAADLSGADPAEAALGAASWVPGPVRRLIVAQSLLDRAGPDEHAPTWFRAALAAGALDAGPQGEALDAHLRLQRRSNLASLLWRLDTSTMQSGVEGRTPFADAVVAGLAESIPWRYKFTPGGPGVPARTKTVLRDAFAADLPAWVVVRPKASFPLPFQEWVRDRAPVLLESPAAREWFRADALAAVAADPTRHWNLAWPMINLALWAERWWGRGAQDAPQRLAA